MTAPACSATSSKSGLDLEAEADPCPMNVGTSTHTVVIDNQRPTAIYHIDVVSRSVFGQVTLTFHHKEPKVPKATTRRPIGTITAALGTENTSDEIETTIEYYDGTQRSGTTFTGPKRQVNLTYGLDIH